MWNDAARDIVRMPPHVFAALSSRAVAHFEKLGCSVPQPTPEPQVPLKLKNAIRGQFARAGQIDYAIVCSIDGQSHVEVFWGGGSRCPALEQAGPDRNFLQGLGGDAIGYSRSIWTLSKRDIERYRRENGEPRRADRTHDGIDDYFEGKASVVVYRSQGEWQSSMGMD